MYGENLSVEMSLSSLLLRIFIKMLTCVPPQGPSHNYSDLYSFKADRTGYMFKSNLPLISVPASHLVLKATPCLKKLGPMEGARHV